MYAVPINARLEHAMSVKVSARVWERAPQQSGALLVLLAMADFADDDGVCFPTLPVLAAKARLTTRQTRTIIRRLDAEQAIIAVHGSGRGHRSRYLVLVGLRPSELRAMLARRENDELFSPFLERGKLLLEKGKSVQQKGEVCDTEKGKSVQLPESPNVASARAELPPADVMIRHEDPSWDPSSPPPPTPASTATPAGGGGGPLAERLPDGDVTGTPSPARSRPSGPRPGAVLLASEGFKTPGIREFGHYPPEVLARDIARMRAEGTDVGGMVLYWREFPPGTTPPKEPTDAPYPPGRRPPRGASPTSAAAGRQPGQPAPGPRAARPGELAERFRRAEAEHARRSDPDAPG